MNSGIKWMSFILVAVFLLGGCQLSPKESSVISKNGGVFLENSVIRASENHSPDETQEIYYSDEFYSTDNSVLFRFDIGSNISHANMPIVEVQPYYLTAEDAKKVAEVLFGDTVCFEKDPMLDHQYSKQGILDCVERWSQYTNTEAVTELLGGSNDHIINQIKGKIAEFTELYESAPAEDPHEVCQWTFKNEDAYVYANGDETDNGSAHGNKAIMATYAVNDVVYAYNAVTRNESDFKLNVISAYLYPDGSPLSIDEAIFRAKLCRTSKPSSECISEIAAKAETMLEDMKLGNWYIDQTFIKTTEVGDASEYVVCINAVPEINGVRATRQAQITNLTSNSEYASNYYITDVNFEFSANGDLLSFTMTSPLEIKRTINENVKVIPVSELLEYAKKFLEKSDIEAYGYGEYYKNAGIAEKCTVIINTIEYSLARIKAPNSDDTYYYVPALTLFGEVQYRDEESGDVFYTSNEPEALIILNCVDGTVIDSCTVR